MHDIVTTRSVLVRVARAVGRAARYEAFADFKDALRCRLAHLHIPYAPVEFDAAITVVTSNTRLWGVATSPRVEPPVDPPGLSTAEAATVLAQLRARVRTMPTVARAAVDPASALRLRAARMIANAMLESIARCEALEREGDQ